MAASIVTRSLPTPYFAHLSSDDWEHVYEPSEDTFLMMDALETEQETIRSRRPLVCVEVGSGAGLLLAAVAKILDSTAFYLGTDVNVCASQATALTLQANSVQTGDSLCTDLGFDPCVQLCAVERRLAGKVDLLLFNPPYVPTPSSEVGGTGIESAWAGGEDGCEVIRRFLPAVHRLLSPEGLFYLLILHQNKPEAIAAQLSLSGLTGQCVAARELMNEKLYVWRFESVQPMT